MSNFNKNKRHFPEGSYTVTKIVAETECGETFVWDGRNSEHPEDDGEYLYFDDFHIEGDDE